MKLLAVSGALVIQSAAAKSWDSDSYSEEMFSVFGWIGYLKRFSLTVLMLSVVVLYYIPESRPYARRICYMLIDLTANGLKSALSGRESEYVSEKIKSKYHRARHEQSLAAQKCALQEIRDDYENFAQPRGSFARKPKIFVDVGSRDTKKMLSRHGLRSSVIKNDPCVDVVKPAYFYSDKTNDAQKCLKNNVSSAKHANGPPVENYALLISGSPQQMAMLDQKYEKDDVVIVQDPYTRMEYKECGTSTDKLLSKAEASSSEQEGPTRDHDEEEAEMAEDSGSRYSVDKSLYQISEYHCGGECCGSNECSMSSADVGNRANTPVGQRNALKSSRSMVAPASQRKIGEGNERLYTIDYSRAGDRPMKRVNSSNSRRIDFRAEDRNRGHETRTQQKHEENERLYENILKTRRKRFRNESVADFCGNDVLYFTDRGGEADDENSQHGGRTCKKHDLDEKPQRENPLFEKSSDDSMFDCYDDIYEEPILKNRFKPALLRAVNWIFGGCPGATRRAALKCEIGKEESQGLTDEWLL